jgi:hypothetical protein
VAVEAELAIDSDDQGFHEIGPEIDVGASAGKVGSAIRQ